MRTEPQAISEAVATWLHYQSLTGIGGLFNESLMTIPIAKYLSSQHGREIKAEQAHPLLKTTSRGRPKQIDFVRFKGGDKTWHAAYETKFKTRSYPLIVNDICRLVCLAQDTNIGNPARYLIYGCEVNAEGVFLSKDNNTGEGGREVLFDRILEKEKVGEKKKIKISTLPQKGRKPFAKFSMDQSISLPSVLETKLLGKFQSGRHMCAVWQILALSGSSLIDHSSLA